MPIRRFIKWTHDTFKAGGNKSELLPLLERCTRELQGVERYKDDARYLRVWIQYARPTARCHYHFNTVGVSSCLGEPTEEVCYKGDYAKVPVQPTCASGTSCGGPQYTATCHPALLSQCSAVILCEATLV